MTKVSAPFSESVELLRCTMPSRIEDRDAVIRAVLQAADKQGFEVDPHFHRLCLDEALINSVVHGNEEAADKKVEVIVYASPKAWAVDVIDQGTGFDWQARLDELDSGLEDDRLSGRGLDLIRQSAAQVEFLEGGRRLRMIWKSEGER